MSEVDQYDYDLPKELIAQFPLACRSDARLLLVERRTGSVHHVHVRDLPELLDPRDCLVLNDTRVVPARLLGYRAKTGGRWEGLFLSADPHGLWMVIGTTRGHLQPGETLVLQDCRARDALIFRLLTPVEHGTWIGRPESDEPALELLERVGRVPLPPYIRSGEMVDSDRVSYQTVYAEAAGAVAAPTAGLHFTTALLATLQARGIRLARVTLHVGPGTFRPIKSDRLADHPMHSEWGRIDQPAVDMIDERRRGGGRIIAVGTTTMRVLETAARPGRLCPWSGETNLFIRPPFQFQACDALLTNFHLPRSTLLVLVRTFGGDELIRCAYEEAVREQYRFFSYGDAMLIV